MNRLDELEARLKALEDAAGSELKDRIQQLEDLLGLRPSHPPYSKVHCTRCGMDQTPDFKCPQAKCPLKA